MRQSRKYGFVIPAALLLFILGVSLDFSNTRQPRIPVGDLPGWEIHPDLPGTMICRTPGGVDWIVETGSDERPASGRALEAGDLFVNKLSVRFPGGGASFAYEPRGAAVQGRALRELVFPVVEEIGVRIWRRLYIDKDGLARWLDVFVNMGATEIAFQAVLEIEMPVKSSAEPRLALSSIGLNHRLASFETEDFVDTSAARDCPARRVVQAYEIVLQPGESAGILSFALPASSAEEAEALARQIERNPGERTAWLSPREKACVKNFSLDAAAASNVPTIRLNSAINEELDQGFCYGVAPVQIEAWDDESVVWMELTYWEDWDLPQGHTYYEHPLTTDGTAAQHLLYNICWDIPNSPRHSGGFWMLEGTAWDAEGQAGTFKTGPFTVWGTCPSTCQPSVVILDFPRISFLQPREGQTVSGLFSVQVEALSSVGVAEVNLSIDGSPVASWSPSPVPTQFVGSYPWDTRELEHLSSHTLRAEIRDSGGFSASTYIDVVVVNPTSISILRPLAGQFVWGIVPVDLEARAGVGIAEVKLLVDGVQTAAWSPAGFPTEFVASHDWNTLGFAFHSSHTLRAEVRDQTGEIAATETAVTATCVQTTLQGRLIRGFGFSSVLLDIVVANPDDLPVAHYVLYKKSGSGDFLAYRTLPLTAFTGGRCVVGDSPVPTGGSFAYRLDAIAANGQVIGRSETLIL